MPQQILSIVEQNPTEKAFSRSNHSEYYETMDNVSQNVKSHKSLLTEVLKLSESRTQNDLPDHERDYLSQVVLREVYQDYSNGNLEGLIDREGELKKLSFRSLKQMEVKKQRIQKELVVEKENREGLTRIVRRKEKRIRKEEFSCSRCEIF